MCLYPGLGQNPKYKANKKNGGAVPPLTDKRIGVVPIGCQRCMECRRQKAREWQVRLLEEVRDKPNGKFVTLTFSNEAIVEVVDYIKEKTFLEMLKEPKDRKQIWFEKKGYDKDNQIAKVALRLFLERWRKRYGESVRHWMVTELGHRGTENVHMHGILWTDDLGELEKLWKYGYVWKGYETGKQKNVVNARTVNYVIKYILKQDEKHERYKSRVYTSAGIGAAYATSGRAKRAGYKGEDTDETYRTEDGHKISMPTYWRNKIYSEEEREKLWLQRLDKQVRWVGGEEIDVSKGMDEYYKTLEWYREKNRRLGYGDNTKDWDKEVYENARRDMLLEQRMKK